MACRAADVIATGRTQEAGARCRRPLAPVTGLLAAAVLASATSSAQAARGGAAGQGAEPSRTAIAIAPAAPQSAPPVPASPQRVSFPTGAGLLLASIRPDKTADFESLMTRFREALLARGEEGARLATAWTVYRASEPAPGGANVLYLILVDPADPTADYSWQQVLQTLYESWPDRGAEFFTLATTVHGGPFSKLTLTKVVPRPPKEDK